MVSDLLKNYKKTLQSPLDPGVLSKMGSSLLSERLGPPCAVDAAVTLDPGSPPGPSSPRRPCPICCPSSLPWISSLFLSTGFFPSAFKHCLSRLRKKNVKAASSPHPLQAP